MESGKTVLCGANAYEMKYYFNESFSNIPESVKEELHILCVLFTEEVGGVFTIAFEEDGNVVLETNADDDDIYYDEITSGLMVSQVRRHRQELFETLRLYYRVFVLKEDGAACLGEEACVSGGVSLRQIPRLGLSGADREVGRLILVIDVGNTNMTLGVYEGEELKATFRIMTKMPRTSDEYGVLITQLLEHRGIEAEKLEGSIVASVVPDVMHALMGALARYTGTRPMNVGPGVKTGIRIVTEDPRAIGADRIVDAVAAYVKYGGPVLVLDFGTATTYDLITESGEFAAGITAPGIRISSEALWAQAAKLPEIEIRKPRSILAQETISSMQAGIVYGQIGQTEYIVRKVREESRIRNLKVVATGGLGRLIAEETDAIDIYDSSLTLDGLRIVYEKNKR